jgi:hypothetical protein
MPFHMVSRNGALERAMSGLLRGENPDILNNLLMTDEAHFHLSGLRKQTEHAILVTSEP